MDEIITTLFIIGEDYDYMIVTYTIQLQHMGLSSVCRDAVLQIMCTHFLSVTTSLDIPIKMSVRESVNKCVPMSGTRQHNCTDINTCYTGLHYADNKARVYTIL